MNWNKVPAELLAQLCQKTCSKPIEHAEFAQVSRSFHLAAKQPNSWPFQWIFHNEELFQTHPETKETKQVRVTYEKSSLSIGHDWSQLQTPMVWTEKQWKAFEISIKNVKIQDLQVDIESVDLFNLIVPLLHWKYLESISCTTLCEQLVQYISKGSCPKLKDFSYQQTVKHSTTRKNDIVNSLKRILLSCGSQLEELELDFHPLFPTWTQDWKSSIRLSIPRLENLIQLSAQGVSFGDVDERSLFRLEECTNLNKATFLNCMFLKQECYPCQLTRLEIIIDEEEHFQAANAIPSLVQRNCKTLTHLIIRLIELHEERESSTCTSELLWKAIFQCTNLHYLNIADKAIIDNLSDLQKLINLQDLHLQTCQDSHQLKVELPISLKKVILDLENYDEKFTLQEFGLALTRRWCFRQVVLDELEITIALNKLHVAFLVMIRVRKLKLSLIRDYRQEQKTSTTIAIKQDNSHLEEIHLVFHSFNMDMALEYLKCHFPVLKTLHILILSTDHAKQVNKERMQFIFQKERFPCLESIFLDDKMNLFVELDEIFTCKRMKIV